MRCSGYFHTSSKTSKSMSFLQNTTEAQSIIIRTTSQQCSYHCGGGGGFGGGADTAGSLALTDRLWSRKRGWFVFRGYVSDLEAIYDKYVSINSCRRHNWPLTLEMISHSCSNFPKFWNCQNFWNDSFLSLSSPIMGHNWKHELARSCLY